MADVLKDIFKGKCEAQIKSIMRTEKVAGLSEEFRQKNRNLFVLLKTQEEKDKFFDLIQAQQQLEDKVREELFLNGIKLGFNLCETIKK